MHINASAIRTFPRMVRNIPQSRSASAPTDAAEPLVVEPPLIHIDSHALTAPWRLQLDEHGDGIWKVI